MLEGMSQVDSQAVGSIATSVGVIVALFAALYAAKQLQTARKIAHGQFLLDLDEAFVRHRDIHMRLRPRGLWADGKTGPMSSDEWIATESYMGLFERIKVLLDNGVIDFEVFCRLYGYRMSNIVANPRIREEKLIRQKGAWQDFIELWNKVERRNQRRSRPPHKLADVHYPARVSDQEQPASEEFAG
jgi:hypothetical protein